MGFFAPYHFDPAAHDAQIAAHGVQARLRRAQRCACWNAQAKEPDPSCTLCFPYGRIWDLPEVVRLLGPGRRAMRNYESEGERELGDCTFTFPSGIVPPAYSRITLPLSIITEDDLLTKGKADVIRYSEVVGVDSAFYTLRNPPTGEDFVTERHDLVLGGPGADITVAGRHVTWMNQGIPNGTRYSVRFRALAEYVVWDVQDRNEGDRPLPFRFVCKKLEFYLHPRESQAVSY